MSSTAKKHRAFLIKTYNHLYERHFSSKPGCFYCGEPAGTIDHCPPITLCETKNQQWFAEKKIKFYKVICCFDCNKKLGDKQLLTLHERANFILTKLENKTDKLVMWSIDELEEMSKMFKKMIESKQKQHDILFERVRFCQELMFSTNDFPFEDNE